MGFQFFVYTDMIAQMQAAGKSYQVTENHSVSAILLVLSYTYFLSPFSAVICYMFLHFSNPHKMLPYAPFRILKFKLPQFINYIIIPFLIKQVFFDKPGKN